MEWRVRSDGLTVGDAGHTELRVTSPDLSVRASDTTIPRPVDVTVDCEASELRFPVAVVYIASQASDATYELENDTGPLDLPAGEYVLDIDTHVKTYLQVDGPLSVSKTPDFEQVVVTFPDRRELTLGFRSRNDRPTDTVTVPETPTGFAAAVTHASSAHKTTGADRTYPTLRGHPPLVELGDSVDVPDAVADATPDVGIELLVPPEYETLYTTAPLAYYLQASVETADVDQPLLCAPSAGIREPLSPMPRLETDVQRLLRKTFFLDCLVRNSGPYGTNLAEESLLDALDLDGSTLYHADPVERLETYLDVPFQAVEHRLPDWHLSTYVDPDPAYVETLPFLLDSLSLVFPPRTSELEGAELVERSLDDFYRGTQGPGEVATVDVVKPELRGGRVHGWLADGVPIDVFKSTPSAYRNRLSYMDRDHEDTIVSVVLNDQQMDKEHADVASIYREGSEDLPITVDVYEELSTDELAAVFEAENDFVHYIGHCEADGLRCPDGYMPASVLDEVNTQTFFLNACGSFHEGMALVEKGAVTGGVTFTQVLNDHAVKVGSAFARLLIHGFSFERALRIARRRIMMGKDYAVVGDGTHTLSQTTNRLPTTAELERLAEDQFFLMFDQFSIREAGAYYHPYVADNEYSYLSGNTSEFALDRRTTVDFLARADTSVIFDGEFYWSDELAAELANELSRR
ncbi:hypothetical protein [Halorubellus sp. PRR65]|uniref:hypothetical protein n=1 Tax=Halorubellus sp. PRR65 TaxID=3098148 RepID=UPI002B26227B|nr:hypothetical protein [Halorubellus sp. PRR65]